MSGRSAYVRKKATEPKSVGGSRGRAKSVASSDNATINDYPIASIPSPHHDQARRRDRGALEADMLAYHNGATSQFAKEGSGSQSESSLDARRERPGTAHAHARPNDTAYGRPTRPTIRTDDISGIEKSGLRSVLDKKSDDVRKGLAKAFAFKKKGKREGDAGTALDFRPESSATVRPTRVAGVRPQVQGDGYEPAITPADQRHAPRVPDAQRDEVGDMVLPSPSALSTTAPEAATPPIKRWVGAGRPVQRWNKLKKDPELWDPNGDVLIFLDYRDRSPPARPSFRLSSHIIEATGSRFLITLLREGSTEADMHIPVSPAGAPPMLQRQGPHAQQQHLAPGAFGRGGQLTPPGSESSSMWEMDGQISYEMYFPTPTNLTVLDQLRYNITTRNVLALLCHASLAGFTLYQALTDLHARLESWMALGTDNVGTILNYLSARGIDDVRNDPDTAISLLAWSEGREVRWEDGWRESFLHCAGLYAQLEACADFKHVTPITRALLERANLETQLRVQAAEERLTTFEYSDMWPASVAMTASASGPVAAAPAKAAMDRLQQFFVQYYTREFGAWPPPEDPTAGTPGAESGDEDIWLTRTVAQLLQRDFAALYDYLVNRDIVWDESETRSSRKWMMVSESGNRGFEADTPDLPLTDMLIEFDNKHRCPHIPYPYPLVPDSIPPLPGAGNPTKESSASGIFSRKTGAATQGGNGNGRAGSVERRIQLAYTEATNICILGSDFTHSNLVDAFSKFEKSDQVGEVDPSTARRGRWVLIYGILQTLASVSVDAPTVRYRDGVSYHLSPRLKGVKMPPWKTSGGARPNPHEAAHELSHCWTVPATWNAGGDVSNSGTEDSAEEGISPISYDHSSGRNYSFPIPRGMPPQRTRGSIRSASSSRAPSLIGGGGGMYTPFSSATSAASVMSYSGSDTGSSVRPPSSAGGPRPGRRPPPRETTRRAKVPVVEEHEWTAPGQPPYVHGALPPLGFPYSTQLHSGKRGNRDHGYPHYGGGGGGGGGAFSELDDLLDEEVDIDGETFVVPHRRPEEYMGKNRAAAAVDGAGKAGGATGEVFDRPLLDRGGSDMDAEDVGPVIRDFDELGVMD